MEKMFLLVALVTFLVVVSKVWPRTRKQTMAYNIDHPGWSELDIRGLKQGFRDNVPAIDLAGQLLRTEEEIKQKALELGLKLRCS